jgi:tetratricopeptide (TPR) repeat protein
MSDRALKSSELKEKSAALYRQGNLKAAKELLDGYLEACQEDHEALFLRAGIFTKTGAWEYAERDLRLVLSTSPLDYECLVLLGLVLKNQGRYAESIEFLSRAISIDPNGVSGYNTLGMCYLSMREIDKAIEAFQKAVERDPASGPIYQNLGLALRLGEKRYQALAAFRQAADLAPENPSNYLSLAQQLRRMGMKTECAASLERGCQKHPTSLALILALAQAYADLNRPEEAETLFKQCLDTDPTAVQAYALWLQKEGRFEESLQRLRQSVQEQPAQGLAYLSLAEAKEFRLEDGTFWAGRIPDLLESPRLPRLSKMYLWYALGRAREADREYESAMAAFDSANELAFALYNAGRPFNFETGRRVTDRTIGLYSSQEFAKVSGCGSASTQPILIVGMIRSGTTLLDQILSCHTHVKPAGECEFWMEESDHLYARWSEGVREEDLPGLAERYLKTLAAETGDSTRITDKMPLNYQHLGHIHAALPKAKILHIRRNPIDTCLSIYWTHFGSGPHFAYKKRNIAFYYQEYLRLMEHWRSVLPKGAMFELDYEELVEDQERVAREVLSFCELPWEEACLHPEDNSLRISTPSRWQARQPIYRSSVEKWRRFEPWLGDFDVLKSASHPPLSVTTPSKGGKA